MRIWVDASKFGLAAVAENGDSRWTRGPYTGHSVLDELHAIRHALEWLTELNVDEAVILCDNTSAVKAVHDVGNGGPVGMAHLASAIRYDMRPGWLVAWVPRKSNAAANALARRGQTPDSR